MTNGEITPSTLVGVGQNKEGIIRTIENLSEAEKQAILSAIAGTQADFAKAITRYTYTINPGHIPDHDELDQGFAQDYKDNLYQEMVSSHGFAMGKQYNILGLLWRETPLVLPYYLVKAFLESSRAKKVAIDPTEMLKKLHEEDDLFYGGINKVYGDPSRIGGSGASEDKIKKMLADAMGKVGTDFKNYAKSVNSILDGEKESRNKFEDEMRALVRELEGKKTVVDDTGKYMLPRGYLGPVSGETKDLSRLCGLMETYLERQAKRESEFAGDIKSRYSGSERDNSDQIIGIVHYMGELHEHALSHIINLTDMLHTKYSGTNQGIIPEEVMTKMDECMKYLKELEVYETVLKRKGSIDVNRY